MSLVGLHVAKVVRNCPNSLTYCEARIRGTIAFLDGVGLDGAHVVNGFPIRGLLKKLATLPGG